MKNRRVFNFIFGTLIVFSLSFSVYNSNSAGFLFSSLHAQATIDDDAAKVGCKYHQFKYCKKSCNDVPLNDNKCAK